MPERAALYIDGFNLFHAIDDLGPAQAHLKWVDLWLLGERLIRPETEQLARVVWCTAVVTDDTQKMLRHRAFSKAQAARGVLCVEGHFANEERECRSCHDRWKQRTEKQGDVNLAVHVISDGHRDLYDVAYLVTADSDQAATASKFRQDFPTKRLISVAPPDRQHSKHILRHTHAGIVITQNHLEWCLLDKTVLKDGAPVCQRPVAYDPPAGWKNPRAPRIALAKKARAPEPAVDGSGPAPADSEPAAAKAS